MPSEPDFSTCFACGAHNPVGLHLLQHTRFLDDEVVIDANLGPFYAGFPGMAHGGVVATMIDEAIQLHAHRVLGLLAPTVQLNITFTAPVPTETPVQVRGRGTRDGRKVLSSASITDADGNILASAEAVLVVQEEVAPARR
jgi:acyl-coenzyme A thioesterase PaaI-like protein